MLAFSNLLPDTKSAKHRGYRFSPSADVCGGTVVYSAVGQHARYWVEEFPADLAGRAFRFVKVVSAGEEGGAYECLAADRQDDDLCDCKGFTAHGHCKHLDVIRDLLAHNQLTPPMSNPDADAANTEFDDVYAGYESHDEYATETASEHIARVRRRWAEMVAG